MKAALLGLLLLAASQDDVVKKVLPEAEKAKRSTKKISKESRDRIEKALGEKLAEADLNLQLWECLAAVPPGTEKVPCRVAVASAKGPKGLIRLAAAVWLDEKMLVAVKILDNADDKAVESKHFLAQFAGLTYTEQIYSPPDALGTAAKKAQEPGSKELDMLFKMNGLMRKFAWERMVEKLEKKDASAAADLDVMDKALDESIRLVPLASFLPATSQDKFKGYAAAARTDLADMKRLVAAGKFDDAYRKAGEVDSTKCSKCHSPYRPKFRDARLKHGIGNGFFSTKLDVSVPEPSLEASCQAVATALRKAILLASEAK